MHEEESLYGRGDKVGREKSQVVYATEVIQETLDMRNKSKMAQDREYI